MDAQTIVNLATPVIVPIIIAGVKKISPKIPTYILPVIAPILGAVIGIISAYALQFQGNIWLSVGLGLAGVGVREVIDQLKSPPPSIPAQPAQ